MKRIVVANAAFSAFLSHLFAGANGQVWQVSVRQGEVECLDSDPLLAAMIERGSEGKSFIVPFWSKAAGTDRWMLTGEDRFALERAAIRVGRALVPSFATFPASDRVASLNPFRPGENHIQTAGAVLFPHGYYVFISPVNRRHQVRERLLRWIALEDEQPAPRDETPPTYAHLVQRFEAATAASQWGDADTVLQALEQFNLCTADNFRFLQMILLARQGRWSEIWLADDRPRVCALRMPRAVRAAMLQSFHATILASTEREEGARAALARYQSERDSARELLTGRFGLTLPPVLMTFGYEAAHVRDRQMLEELQEHADEPARLLLQALAELLPVTGGTQGTSTDAVNRVRVALELDDLDAALVAADDILDAVQRLVARVEVAARSADAPLCVEVLGEWQRADTAVTGGLLVAYPSLPSQIHLVAQTAGQRVSPVAKPSRWHSVRTWLDWFEQAAGSPIDADAHAALDQVEGSFELAFSDAWAAALADAILTVGTDDVRRQRPVVREAARRLAQEVVAETAFPRDGFGACELYEAVVTQLLETGEHNDDQSLLLLGLIEAILDRQPTRVQVFAQSLCDWFSQPAPALEHRALDAFELATDFGVAPYVLTATVRAWVADLLLRPISWNTIHMALWQQLVAWTRAGEDLEHQLDRRLAEERAGGDIDPIAQLPAGFHIGIFTLRPASAEHARAQLLERNSSLRVSICDAKVLTEEAKDLARSASMPVVVTRSVTHALTDGIRPFLAHDPVYPPASGVSGIVVAVVEAAKSIAVAPVKAA